MEKIKIKVLRSTEISNMFDFLTKMYINKIGKYSGLLKIAAKKKDKYNIILVENGLMNLHY